MIHLPVTLKPLDELPVGGNAGAGSSSYCRNGLVNKFECHEILLRLRVEESLPYLNLYGTLMATDLNLDIRTSTLL